MYNRWVPPPKGATAQPKPPPSPEPPHVETGPSVRPSSTPYARYIPPPKKTLQTPPALPAAAVGTITPRKIVFDDGPIDDAASAPQHSGTTATPAKATEDDGGPPRRKRAKIGDSPSSQSTPNQKPSGTVADAAVAAVDAAKTLESLTVKPRTRAAVDSTAAESPPVPLGKKEKKKEKKEKKKITKDTVEATGAEDLEMTDADALGAQEDPVAGRHKSILKKRDAALQKTVRTPTESNVGDGGATGQSVEEPLAQLYLDQDAAKVHGLEPLPQPALLAPEQADLAYDTLPPWLQNPSYVSSETQADWGSLGLGEAAGISPEVGSYLASKGYPRAFAVQTAVIPRLLPNPARQGDLVISAATGSGKTLAYVLPMVRDISQSAVTKLRAVIVVPTRELVQQVQDVCNICAAAYARQPHRKAVKIGIAVGNQAFKKEQEKLVGQGRRYDPEGYRRLVESRQWASVREKDLENPSFDLFSLAQTPLPLVNHVTYPVPKVDILICTPGRLVEHIEHTPGFDLDYVRWLVVDEADKLLEQSYQQWLDLVMEKLSKTRPGCRDFMFQNKSGVRKVVLSATMTRNLSLLGKLNLHRPEMIVLESSAVAPTSAPAASVDRAGVPGETVPYELALPVQLREFAIKVRDPEQKPLYLLDLLNSQHVRSRASETVDEGEEEDDSDSSDTSSDGSESTSSADTDNNTASTTAAEAVLDTVLIFTKSNESALRLSRLLEILAPKRLASRIGTLTSTTRTSERKKVINAYKSGKLRVLVASDLVARGLDLPKLDHVVNYDMPPSVRAYVHRVGRTARAGRPGRAWTLFTKTEAGWFFAEVAGAKTNHGSLAGGGEEAVAIHRLNKLQTVVVTPKRSADDLKNGPPGDFGAERISCYEEALEKLGKEARS